MLIIEQDDKHITIIRERKWFIPLTVLFFALLVYGFFNWIKAARHAGEHAAASVTFISTIAVVVLCFSVFLVSIFFKKIVIDDSGITGMIWFASRQISWSELRDWGVSPAAGDPVRTQVEGSMYCLYFSRVVLPVDRNGRKKVDLNAVQISFRGAYFKDQIIERVIPFCTSRMDKQGKTVAPVC